MSHETQPDSEAIHSTSSEANNPLQLFNEELKAIQEKYSLRLIGVPVFTPDGRVTVLLQVLDTTLLPIEESEEVTSE